MKFVHKPVIIEATRFPVEVPEALTPDYNRAFVALADWCGGMCVGEVEGRFAPRIEILTLEGKMIALPGDWIIKGVKGEFYPCKPDIFEITYDVVPIGAVAKAKSWRRDLDQILQQIKESKQERTDLASSAQSDEGKSAMHYIKNAIMWLGLELKRLGEANPYPQSYDPSSPRVEPTADNLKL